MSELNALVYGLQGEKQRIKWVNFGELNLLYNGNNKVIAF